MGKRWRVRPHDADRVAYFERSAGVAPLVAHLLLSRGVVDPSAAKTFLEAKLGDLRDPGELPGVNTAADRVHEAVRDKRRIVIYGDYDADGMTATAILYNCLQLLGADVGYYVPNRLEDGYGLNHDALETLARRGAKMIITVDCGIASVSEAEKARELGLELIITDHHEMGERLPEAAALVHPRLPGTHYPFGGLCGAGVALKLAWAICQRASGAQRVAPRMREFLLSALGLAAIGTVADVVPLIDENRLIVRHGLASLSAKPPPGLAALIQITKLDRNPTLSSEDIAFSLGPRLNAAGRLGQAQLGVELLTTQSQERAQSLAEYIHELNKSRDSLDRSILLAARKQIKEHGDADDEPALVLAGRGWHAGVIGIVAGRLAERYHRPVVMISLDELGVKPGIGSARSIPGFNLYDALTACAPRLVGYGGHAAAAGLRIDEAEVEGFRAEFCEFAAANVTAESRVASLHIDVEAPLSQLTLRTIEQMEQLAPFGEGNPRPLLCTSGVELVDAPRRMGEGARHLSLKVRQQNLNLRAVAFGKAEWAEEIEKAAAPLDIAYRPVINQFRGRRSVELHLVDWRVAKQDAPVGA
ncbi:MAG: single-stranded-DNA-specific exonuclease RecJ [Pirellulaceae bacterium]